MRAVLAVCREYGQDLEWWDSLDRGAQVLYLADRRVRLTDEVTAAQRASRSRRRG